MITILKSVASYTTSGLESTFCSFCLNMATGGRFPESDCWSRFCLKMAAKTYHDGHILMALNQRTTGYMTQLLVFICPRPAFTLNTTIPRDAMRTTPLRLLTSPSGRRICYRSNPVFAAQIYSTILRYSGGDEQARGLIKYLSYCDRVRRCEIRLYEIEISWFNALASNMHISISQQY